MLVKFNLACELVKTIKHYFPDLIPQLKQITDERDPRYTKYELALVLMVRIMSAIFMLPSMRGMSAEFSDDNLIANIAKLAGCDGLMELPHYSTINNCLAQVEPSELQEILHKMAYRLIRSKAFLDSRIYGTYWQILVDGSQLYSFRDRHCAHCLFREHKKDGKTIRADYYHYVLEAKLVIMDNIVISICTEFVENNGPQTPGLSEEDRKQDCERKAFYRLEQKLKAAFPRLPVCITADSLYACEPVFQICKNNGWRYIIRFKDGSIKTLAAEFHTLKQMEAEQCFRISAKTASQEYRFVRGMDYQGFAVNAAECVETVKTKKGPVSTSFVFITDLHITVKRCVLLIKYGRRRWLIENEGFDAQKNHGYNLKHIFSRGYTAMRNHYFLIQIAHAISQLMALVCRDLKHTLSISTEKLHRLVFDAFKKAVLTGSDMAYVEARFQVRRL